MCFDVCNVRQATLPVVAGLWERRSNRDEEDDDDDVGVFAARKNIFTVCWWLQAVPHTAVTRVTPVVVQNYQ